MFKSAIYSAVNRARQVHISNFGKITDIVQKEDRAQIVTQVDLESEHVIIETIQELYPDHQIISEECGFIAGNSAYTWVIDPLDGTSNYAAGIPWCGIMIAVMKEMKPITCAIVLPQSDSYYFAELDGGAYLNETRIQVSEAQQLHNTLIAYSLDYSEEVNRFDRDISLFRAIVKHSRNVRSTNSLVDYCYTAEGKFGACINLSNKIWDIAATSLLIKEAGGIATDDLGRDLDLSVDQSDYQRDFACVAANPTIHRQLIKLLDAHVGD